ncbi:response regulator [Patescibacteria group bacterium]|nr:response regulator [Patescibacteria group bacterium]MDE1941185.1 response regulator [Patescibacteria group bacterium]
MRRSKILVVDDIGAVRQLVVITLAGLDHAEDPEIVECADAFDAIDRIESGERFDLVVTDFRIPRGREGKLVAETAKRRDPGIPVICMSGDMTDQDQAETPADVFLVKPFKLKDLLGAAERLLGKVRHE